MRRGGAGRKSWHMEFILQQLKKRTSTIIIVLYLTTHRALSNEPEFQWIFLHEFPLIIVGLSTSQKIMRAS